MSKKLFLCLKNRFFIVKVIANLGAFFFLTSIWHNLLSTFNNQNVNVNGY